MYAGASLRWQLEPVYFPNFKGAQSRSILSSFGLVLVSLATRCVTPAQTSLVQNYI